jgi:hypothetical protein
MIQWGFGFTQKRFVRAFLIDGATTQNSRSGEVSEGRDALRTAGLETGATILGGA